MTDKPQKDVITNAEVTKNDANYVRALESRIVDLERKLQFPESDSSLFVPRTWHEGMLANVKAQLPEGMQNCTILFKECERGHGYLQPDNWVDHGCPTCECTALAQKVELLTQSLKSMEKHRDELIENATRHESRMAKALHDRLAARDEAQSLRNAYAALLQSHERLQRTFGISSRQLDREPLAADEHGPIYKDDLCPDALRDGYLRRSAASKALRTAQPPKQEGDYGIEIISNGPSECTRQNCPTTAPHRHITDPNEDLEHVIAARRARMMATIADADSDAPGRPVPPQHTINNDSALDQLRDSARMKPISTEEAVDLIRNGQTDRVYLKKADETPPRRPDEQDDPTEFHGVGPFSDETSNTPDKQTEER